MEHEALHELRELYIGCDNGRSGCYYTARSERDNVGNWIATEFIIKLLDSGFGLPKLQKLQLSFDMSLRDLREFMDSVCSNGTLRELRMLDLSCNSKRIPMGNDEIQQLAGIIGSVLPKLHLVNLIGSITGEGIMCLSNHMLDKRWPLKILSNEYMSATDVISLLKFNTYISLGGLRLRADSPITDIERLNTLEYVNSLSTMNASPEMLLYNRVLSNIDAIMSGADVSDADVSDADVSSTDIRSNNYYIHGIMPQDNWDNINNRYIHGSASENFLWRQFILPILGINSKSSFKVANKASMSGAMSKIATFLDPLDMIRDTRLRINNIDRYLYTEDDINILLSTLLPPNGYTVSAQTQMEGGDLLMENLGTAIGRALDGETALMPIHVHGNHWVGAMLRPQNNGEVQILYTDSIGDTEDGRTSLQLFLNALTSFATAHPGMTNGINFINLSRNQQLNGYDCGRFVVMNLLRLTDLERELDAVNLRDANTINSIINELPTQDAINTSRNVYSQIIIKARMASEFVANNPNNLEETKQGENANESSSDEFGSEW